MRVLILYQVYDTQAGTTLGPIHSSVNVVPLKRALQDEVNAPDKNNLLARSPEDFELREIGLQDQDTGLIEPAPLPHKVHFNLSKLKYAEPPAE